MTTAQMELTFENRGLNRRANARSLRAQRARWWFDRMRDAVDRAFDRTSMPAPRPEQICLPVYRSPHVRLN